MHHSSSKHKLVRFDQEVIEEKDEEDKESCDDRGEFVRAQRNNLRTIDQRVEFNDSNNLSQQIQLFKIEQTEGQEEANFERNLEKKHFDDSDKIIREYEEEFKREFEKNEYMESIPGERNYPNQLTVTANMFNQNAFIKRNGSIDIQGMGSFASSPNHKDFFSNHKFNLGRLIAVSAYLI